MPVHSGLRLDRRIEIVAERRPERQLVAGCDLQKIDDRRVGDVLRGHQQLGKRVELSGELPGGEFRLPACLARAFGFGGGGGNALLRSHRIRFKFGELQGQMPPELLHFCQLHRVGSLSCDIPSLGFQFRDLALEL